MLDSSLMLGFPESNNSLVLDSPDTVRLSFIEKLGGSDSISLQKRSEIF